MNQTVLVTGGSRGIGRAIVEETARQGWNVAFTYVSRPDAAEDVIATVKAESAGVDIAAFELDVRDSSAVDAIADQVLDRFGGVGAVVCNAGVSLNGLAYAMTDEDWHTVIDTNLTGSFYVCRAFLPELVAQKSGRIILLSSVTAAGASGQAAYAASKAGLQGLASTLAKEYGPKGITCNAVVPGYFETDMTRETMAAELSEFSLKFCPLRRLGQVEELAGTVAFLLGKQAAYINGDVIRVTGGLDWAP